MLYIHTYLHACSTYCKVLYCAVLPLYSLGFNPPPFIHPHLHTYIHTYHIPHFATCLNHNSYHTTTLPPPYLLHAVYHTVYTQTLYATVPSDYTSTCSIYLLIQFCNHSTLLYFTLHSTLQCSTVLTPLFLTPHCSICYLLPSCPNLLKQVANPSLGLPG